LGFLQDAHNSMGAAIYIYRKLIADNQDKDLLRFRTQLRKLKVTIGRLFAEVAGQTSTQERLSEREMTTEAVLSERSKPDHCNTCCCHHSLSFALGRIGRWLLMAFEDAIAAEIGTARLPLDSLEDVTINKLAKVVRVLSAELQYCQRAEQSAKTEEDAAAHEESSTWGSDGDDSIDYDNSCEPTTLDASQTLKPTATAAETDSSEESGTDD
jgi:hypothetical protein